MTEQITIASDRYLIDWQLHWLAAPMEMLAQANEISDGYYADPNWSRLPTTCHFYEESRRVYGNPCKNGFAAKRLDLERFTHHSHDQCLVGERCELERLFLPSSLDT